MNALSIIRLGLLVAVSVFLPFAANASAGADNAKIACRSVSTKGGILNLTGNIPGDFASFELILKRNKSETKLTDTANEEILVVEDFSNKVFTMVVYGNAGRLILYAVPGTVVTKGVRGSAFNARFNAVLSQAPNPAGDEPLRGVKMTCTYEYSI